MILAAVLVISGAIYFIVHQRSVSHGPEFADVHTVLPPKQMPLNITGIGDSLTKGVGDIDQQGYAGLTSQKLKTMSSVSNVTFSDYGVTGDTSKDLLDVLKKKKVKESISQSDFIFMTIGGNDLVDVLKENFLDLNKSDFTKPKKTFTSNLQNIFEKIRALNPNATIYYFGLYNPFENYVAGLDGKFSAILEEWNQSIQQVADQDGNTYFIATSDIFHNHTDELLYKDHFHPNPKGYSLLSNRLYQTIQQTTAASVNN